MELKVRIEGEHSLRGLRFNRTFMELKVKRTRGLNRKTIRFNRTFMELKDDTLCLKQAAKRVSIAPLWN